MTVPKEKIILFAAVLAEAGIVVIIFEVEISRDKAGSGPHQTAASTVSEQKANEMNMIAPAAAKSRRPVRRKPYILSCLGFSLALVQSMRY